MQLRDGAILQGERLILRDLTLDDVGEAYERWMNDPEVIRFLESRFRPHTIASIREFVRAQQDDPASLFLAMVVRDSRRHIGNIKLGNISPHHATGEVGLMIGEKDCWNRGYATEAVRLISDYAFQVLGIHKLIAGFYAANEGSINAFRKAGFSIEGVQKELVEFDGARMDGILMGRIAPARSGPRA
jgi:RimJ/RimL family protein N-acetyltransferase